MLHRVCFFVMISFGIPSLADLIFMKVERLHHKVCGFFD